MLFTSVYSPQKSVISGICDTQKCLCTCAGSGRVDSVCAVAIAGNNSGSRHHRLAGDTQLHGHRHASNTQLHGHRHARDTYTRHRSNTTAHWQPSQPTHSSSTHDHHKSTNIGLSAPHTHPLTMRDPITTHFCPSPLVFNFKS